MSEKLFLYSFEGTAFNKISGDVGYVVPPVPIPNTVVKHSQADGTWLETTWESRRLLVRTLERVSFLFYTN